MTELERLRFYLRDTSAKQVFSDLELQELLDSTALFEEAVGLGWLLKGASAADRVTSRTIGKVSETRSGATESAQTCFALAQYWLGKTGIGVARWMELRPEGGLLGDLYGILESIATDSDYDLSRLLL